MSFQDYYFNKGYVMQKTAGMGMEVAGTLLNPFSGAISFPAGVIGAAVGGKQEAKDIPDGIGSTLSNLLIPGVAPYRLGKRLRGEFDESSEHRDNIRKIVKKQAEQS